MFDRSLDLSCSILSHGLVCPFLLKVINDGFSLVFFAELLLRIFLEPRRGGSDGGSDDAEQRHLLRHFCRTFHRDVSNWLDAFLAIAGLVDFFITISLPETSTSQSVLDCSVCLPLEDS